MFVQANGSIHHSKSKSAVALPFEDGVGDMEIEFTNKYNSIGVGIGAGHFLTEQVGLEAQIFCNSVGYANADRREGQVGISFGIQVHLPKSTKK